MTDHGDEAVAAPPGGFGIEPAVWSAMRAAEIEDDALDAIETAGHEPGEALAAFIACLRRAGLDVEARDGPGGRRCGLGGRPRDPTGEPTLAPTKRGVRAGQESSTRARRAVGPAPGYAEPFAGPRR
jgi:hypothetical protein